jgi:hypothetical protein
MDSEASVNSIAPPYVFKYAIYYEKERFLFYVVQEDAKEEVHDICNGAFPKW